MLHFCSMWLWLLLGSCLTHASYITHQLRWPQGGFRHIVQHASSGDLVVGGKNLLLRVDSSLRLLANVSTGPHRDNPECIVLQGCRDLRYLDADNKAMVLDESDASEPVLLHCDSLFNGVCYRRRLSTLALQDPSQDCVYQFNHQQNYEQYTAICRSTVAPVAADASLQLLLAPRGPGQPQYVYSAATRAEAVSNSAILYHGIFLRHSKDMSFKYQDQFQKSGVRMTRSFRIDYIASFVAGAHAHWITVQKKAESIAAIQTHVARVCVSDDLFQSYSELPLHCEDAQGQLLHAATAAVVAPAGNAMSLELRMPPGELILYVSFQRLADVNRRDTQTPHGGLCLYRMRDLDRKFTKAAQECLKQGIGNYGPTYYSSSHPCVAKAVNVSESYCGEHNEAQQHIVASRPHLATAHLTWTDALSTSLSVALAADYPVVSVGTTDGRLLKMSVVKTDATVYEQLDLAPGQKVRALLHDVTAEHQIVLADKMVLRVAMQNCSRYLSCSACLGAADPYCGWCSRSHRCTQRSECPPAVPGWTAHWLEYRGTRCPAILSVQPPQAHIHSPLSEITLHVASLPPAIHGYNCLLHGGTNVTATKLPSAECSREEGVDCVTCPLNGFYRQLPAIPPGKDFIPSPIQLQTDGVTIDKAEFTVFDCTKHESCSQCTDSQFACHWCMYSNKCTHSPVTACTARTGVTNVVSQAAGVQGDALVGSEHCPRIETIDDETLIPVPGGFPKEITVKAVNLQALHGGTFQCVFNEVGSTDSVPATQTPVPGQPSARIVRCSSRHFEYSDAVGKKKVVFNIQWGSGVGEVLDNPSNIQVEMYKCWILADSCGGCLQLPVRYECGFCLARNECRVQQQCSGGPTGFQRSGHCSTQDLYRVSPLFGPTAGGTLVTIEGQNLGRDMNSLRSVVHIGETPCQVISIKAAESLTCRTGATSMPGVVRVKVQTGNVVTYFQDLFSYVVPTLTKVEPSEGPVQGGSMLTLRGRHLYAGGAVLVQLHSRGQTVNCSVQMDSRLEEELHCVTSPTAGSFSSVEAFDVSLTLDGALLTQHASFRYRPNPRVNGSDVSWTIPSGGITLRVQGGSLQLLQQPQLYISSAPGTVVYEDCTVVSVTELACITPALPSSLRLRRQVSAPFSYGIRLTPWLPATGTNRQSLGTLQLQPNPVFYVFSDTPRLYQPSTEELVLEGEHLLPLRPSDLLIRLGAGFCNFSSFSTTGRRVTCRPPPTQPALGPGQSNYPVLLVQVGSRLNFTLGAVQYAADSEAGSPSLGLILGITLPLAALLTVLLVILTVKYRRKNAKRDRDIRGMQKKMDLLESRVAKECKEAFAELQTDNPELGGGEPITHYIPFLDFRSFSMRVLFPSAGDDHPVLVRDADKPPSEVESVGQEQAVRTFSQLLLNKTFLLAFIGALEAEQSFTMRDRVNVASLLSVALLPRMDYHTDILKLLLTQLVKRSVEGRNHQYRKLLLRRTESVAEKMLTNWFTFLLFRFLQDRAGEPLYILFRAIKQQVDKGPVDQNTGEAKYSLSEDKLIRQQIEYKQLTVHVRDVHAAPRLRSDGSATYSPDVPVKVLDCDTVSQVKDKLLDALYRSTPYSQRPARDSLDLEWVTGQYGRTILLDEDIKTSKEGKWKRLNTLSTYNVSDGAQLAFVARGHPGLQDNSLDSTSLRSAPGRFDNLVYHSFNAEGASPSIGRSLSPNSGVLDLDKEARYFHLVKPDVEDGSGEGSSRMVSEIYLPRLLATKGTFQKFVDDFFDTVLGAEEAETSTPWCIKYMFDFLDDQAAYHNITDPEVVHTWKSNSLPLRFWVNIIKNPQFVFDVHKSGVVDSCLSVIAQTLMDSCSLGELQLSKDSPSSKLLYAKDLPRYKRLVRQFYADVRHASPLNDFDMGAYLQSVSKLHGADFNTLAAVRDLFRYARVYRTPLLQQLRTDPEAARLGLDTHLRELLEVVEESVVSSTPLDTPHGTPRAQPHARPGRAGKHVAQAAHSPLHSTQPTGHSSQGSGQSFQGLGYSASSAGFATPQASARSSQASNQFGVPSAHDAYTPRGAGNPAAHLVSHPTSHPMSHPTSHHTSHSTSHHTSHPTSHHTSHPTSHTGSHPNPVIPSAPHTATPFTPHAPTRALYGPAQSYAAPPYGQSYGEIPPHSAATPSEALPRANYGSSYDAQQAAAFGSQDLVFDLHGQDTDRQGRSQTGHPAASLQDPGHRRSTSHGAAPGGPSAGSGSNSYVSYA